MNIFDKASIKHAKAELIKAKKIYREKTSIMVKKSDAVHRARAKLRDLEDARYDAAAEQFDAMEEASYWEGILKAFEQGVPEPKVAPRKAKK